MRSGTRKFVTAAAVTMALGAGLGTASSAVAAEPATAHTHSAANYSGSIARPAYESQWYYKGTYDGLDKCKAAAIPYLYFGYSDYGCTTTADMRHYELWVLKVWLD